MMESSTPATRAVYDTVAAGYAALLPDTRAESPLDLAMIDAFVVEVSGGLILDAGCGAGRISRYVADRGGHVHGVDLSPRMVEEATAAHPDLSFEVGSLLELPLGEASAAGVLLWYSTIHLTDAELERALEEAARVAQPGAAVLVASQSGDGTVDVREAYSHHGLTVPALHRHRRTAHALAGALRHAGAVELARLQRAATGAESDGQAMVLARFSP